MEISGFFHTSSILINIAFALISNRIIGAFNPVFFVHIALAVACVFYAIVFEAAINIETLLFLQITTLAFSAGVIITSTNNKTCEARAKFNIKYYLVAFFLLTTYVAFTIISSMNGLINYIQEMNNIRNNVANPGLDNASNYYRPSIAHILSISISYVIVANLALKDSLRNKIKTFPLVVVIAVIISFNDISRARFSDLIVLYFMPIIMYSKIKYKYFKMLILFAFIFFAALFFTYFQGKYIDEPTLYGSLKSIISYFALPLYYFSELFDSKIDHNYLGYQTFEGVFNILHHLFGVDYTRLDNRGVGYHGYIAWLVYPSQKYLYVDYGYFLSILMYFIFGVMSSVIFNLSRSNVLYHLIYLILMLSFINFFMGWKLTDNFYIIAIALLFIQIILSKCKKL
ncbi:O-antigen polymerase [Alphaproteobacteria bacterium LSUCC0684]